MFRYSLTVLKNIIVQFTWILVLYSPSIACAADCEDFLDVFETDPILKINEDYLDCIVKSQTEAEPDVIRNLDAFIDTSPDTFFKISYKPDRAAVIWSVNSKANEPLSPETAERVTDALQNLVIKSLEQNKELSPEDRKKITSNIQVRILKESDLPIVADDERGGQPATQSVPLEDLTPDLINKWIDERIKAGDLKDIKDLLGQTPGEPLVKTELTRDGEGELKIEISLTDENQRVLNPDEEKRAKDAIKKALENAIQQHANLTNEEFNNLKENTEIKIREDEQVAEKKEQPPNNDAEPKDKDAEKLAENEPPQKDAENGQDQQVAEKNKKPADNDAKPEDKDAEKIAENEQDQQRDKKDNEPADGDAKPEDKDAEKIAENKQDQQRAEKKLPPAIPPPPAVPFDKLTSAHFKTWLEERIKDGDLNQVKHLLDLNSGKAPSKVQYTGADAGGPALKIGFLSDNQRQLNAGEQNDAKDAIKKALENALQQHANLTNEEFKNIIEATEIEIRRTERPPNPIYPVITEFKGERSRSTPNAVDVSVKLSKPSSQDEEISIAISPPHGSNDEVTITIPAGQVMVTKPVEFTAPIEDIFHRRRPAASADTAVVQVKSVSQNILPPPFGEDGFVIVFETTRSPRDQVISHTNGHSEICPACDSTPACHRCRRKFTRW